jgi:hypothetical protein
MEAHGRSERDLVSRIRFSRPTSRVSSNQCRHAKHNSSTVPYAKGRGTYSNLINPWLKGGLLLIEDVSSFYVKSAEGRLHLAFLVNHRGGCCS